LLNYNQVSLSEEPLNGSMLSGAYEQGRYFTPRDNPDEVIVRDRISAGSFDPTSVGTPAVEMLQPSAQAPEIPSKMPVEIQQVQPTLESISQ
jgi:hypothetical protein